jgi:hypothetical protein
MSVLARLSHRRTGKSLYLLPEMVVPGPSNVSCSAVAFLRC